MTESTARLTIECDASPALSFIHLINNALGLLTGPIHVPEVPADLIRFEQLPYPAGTNKIFIRFYPSDAFLRFAAAIFASQFDLCVINDSSHNTSDMVTAGIDVQRDGISVITSLHRKETI